MYCSCFTENWITKGVSSLLNGSNLGETIERCILTSLNSFLFRINTELPCRAYSENLTARRWFKSSWQVIEIGHRTKNIHFLLCLNLALKDKNKQQNMSYNFLPIHIKSSSQHAPVIASGIRWVKTAAQLPTKALWEAENPRFWCQLHQWWTSTTWCHCQIKRHYNYSFICTWSLCTRYPCTELAVKY